MNSTFDINKSDCKLFFSVVFVNVNAIMEDIIKLNVLIIAK